MNKVVKKIILPTLLLVVSFSITSFAYWASNINTTSTSANIGFLIGDWNTTSAGPTNPTEDLNPPKQPITEIPIGAKSPATSNIGDVVYYNNQLYIKTSKDGTPDDAWAKFENTVFYFSPNDYKANSIIMGSDGVLYKTQSGRYTTSFEDVVIGTHEWLPLEIYSSPWNNQKDYGSLNDYPTGIVSYNGKYYKSRQWTNKGKNPETNPSDWQEITTSYTTGVNYALNQVVLHDGGLYYAVNASRASTYAPGTAYDAWNRMDTHDYQPYNKYTDNSYVRYQGVYFKAVSGANYNNNIPPGTPGAWNRVDTVDYKSTNQYYTGNQVLYPILVEGVQQFKVFKALQPSVGILPDAANGSLYWQ